MRSMLFQPKLVINLMVNKKKIQSRIKHFVISIEKKHHLHLKFNINNGNLIELNSFDASNQ